MGSVMPAERRRFPPAIAATPRDQVEIIHHKEIDNLLKDLRGYSRCLKVAMDSFTDELKVFERLYYKSKNQHRMTLSFKRVIEVRRYARRVEELGVLECVQLLRASFAGLDGTNDRKALKSSWSHVPQESYINYVVERLTSCSTLIHKMRERLEGAHNHFSLAMQSGAFIQLIILFVALCSRMSSLSSEVEDILQRCASRCTRFRLIIVPADQLTTTAANSMQQKDSAKPDSSRTPEVCFDEPTEDVGQPISRSGHPYHTVSVSLQEDEIALRTRVTPCFSSTNAVDHSPPQVSEQPSAKAHQKPHLKRARKRRDEIDEIFGF